MGQSMGWETGVKKWGERWEEEEEEEEEEEGGGVYSESLHVRAES